MSKKHKTKKQKILAASRRQLSPASTISQVPFVKMEKTQAHEIPTTNKNDISSISYDPKLIKKDLLKTVALSFIIISIEIVLYLKLG